MRRRKTDYLLPMKFSRSLALLLFLCLTSARAEKIALVNGTMINPADATIIPNAVIVIEGDHIVSASTGPGPAEAKQIDCSGKFILPGYIDTHVHFFQSGDIYTRPDAVDLTSVRSYADEHAWIRRPADHGEGHGQRLRQVIEVEIDGAVAGDQFAQIGESAFATYEGAQASKKAISKLNSGNLTYVILGLGGLALVALFVLKH